MRPFRRLSLSALAGSMFAVLLAGCGAQPAKTVSRPAPVPAASPAPAPKTPVRTAPQRVTLVLNYIPEGYHAPYYVALKKGFYSAAGLDVTIQPGSASNLALQEVANGAATFGLTDASVVVPAVNKGLPIRMVADYLQKTPLSFIFLASRHVTRPQQMRGMIIGEPPGTTSGQLLPAFLAASGLSVSDVHIASASANSLRSLLETGKIDTYGSYAMTELPALQAQGVKATALNWGDWGVHTLSIGLIANDSTIRRRPAEIRNFLAATARGFKYVAQHPKRSVAILRAMLPSAHLPKGTTTTLKLSLKLLHTPLSAGRPTGWTAPGDWTQTVATMKKYEHLTGAKPAGAYYTDAFFPG